MMMIPPSVMPAVEGGSLTAPPRKRHDAEEVLSGRFVLGRVRCIDRPKLKLVLVLSGKVVVLIRSSRRSRELRPSNQCSV